MVFASKQLRSEEAAAAALGKTLEQMDGYDKTEHSPITPDDSVQHDVLKQPLTLFESWQFVVAGRVHQ